ncbi:MAG: hypothetical protein IPK64_18715 [bacterium]|nr:hypothetical protein [bacterium]
MKKLTLKRESIRQLSFDELQNVAGARPKEPIMATMIINGTWVCDCIPPTQSQTCGSCDLGGCYTTTN